MEMVQTKYRVDLAKNHFESIYWSQGKLIAGIDEVGRGCLAGPLVTAAVVLHPHAQHDLLIDSKELSEKERLEAYQWIIRHSWWALGMACHRLIDSRNIYQATLIAMRKAALAAASICPHPVAAFLVDAMPLNMNHSACQHTDIHYFAGGESISTSIAAASIIAKVTRDRLMHSYEPLIPGYAMSKHKGYGTAAHRLSLAQHGRSIIHRQSFLRNILPLETAHESEQTLC